MHSYELMPVKRFNPQKGSSGYNKPCRVLAINLRFALKTHVMGTSAPLGSLVMFRYVAEMSLATRRPSRRE